MRKAQKKQIEEIIALMAEVQAEIKNSIRKKNTSLALELLEQCQQGAIQVGTSIDALEGEGHPTVTLLEQYCELVYKLHEELANGSLKAGADAAAYAERILGASWTQINKSVEEDVPARIEVVFCPYKASMWDSLESVWKAADEDPNCDAYVIPIPYFDKMPNGAFAEEHYEGLEYPEYVPITYYKSYNFEEHRPDMVFIHNPYDEYNFVTSVHPFYYASNLIKYTDKLVYIPYFVLGEPDWETMTDEGKEKMRMFCIQPGVLQSHKTIVQSEAMKQVYVNTLCNEFGEQHRPMWEDKILSIGSPKMDKVLATTEEDFNIPEEWKPVLYDAHGIIKKVILYNTSVSALLEYEDAMLAKMHRVFETFKENKDEVALLWRPHPLIKATIESMRPKLWQEYAKLVEEYKQAGWGIYDDSAELNRAIELADAYYGDPSSLVQLCQEKGMPVTIQELETEDTNGAYDIARLNVLLYPEMTYSIRKDNFLYFFAFNCNAFMRVDLLDGKVEYLASIPYEDEQANGLLITIGIHNEFILFASSAAKSIYVYDTKKTKFIKASFDADREDKPIRAVRNIRLKDKIYFFPSTEKKEVCLDLQTLSITKNSNMYNEYLNHEKIETGLFVVANSYEYKNKAYAAIRDKGYVVECSLGKHEYNYYKIDDVSAGFMQMCGVENKLYLLSYDKKIIEWNIDTSTVECVWNVELDGQKDIGRLQVCVRIEDSIYFLGVGVGSFAIRGDFGVKLNLTSNTIAVFAYEEEFGITTKPGEMYTFSSMDEQENMYFISTYHNLAMINMRTKQYKNLRLKYSWNQRKRNLSSNMTKENDAVGRQCIEALCSLE